VGGGGGIALTGLAAFIALLIAVYTAKSSLPSYEELKSSPNGQMIRVHAADGTGDRVARAELRRVDRI
jgi:penicillin-binding protein 1A